MNYLFFLEHDDIPFILQPVVVSRIHCCWLALICSIWKNFFLRERKNEDKIQQSSEIGKII